MGKTANIVGTGLLLGAPAIAGGIAAFLGEVDPTYMLSKDGELTEFGNTLVLGSGLAYGIMFGIAGARLGVESGESIPYKVFYGTTGFIIAGGVGATVGSFLPLSGAYVGDQLENLEIFN